MNDNFQVPILGRKELEYENKYAAVFHPIKSGINKREKAKFLVATIALFIFTAGFYHLHTYRKAKKLQLIWAVISARTAYYEERERRRNVEASLRDKLLVIDEHQSMVKQVSRYTNTIKAELKELQAMQETSSSFDELEELE